MDTVIVTGANRGIGLALVKRFVENGDMVLAGCRNPLNADELAALAMTSDLEMIKLDVTKTEDVDALVARLDGRKIDVLVNNAGLLGGERQSVSDMDYEKWREALEVNTLAPFRLATALRPNLQLSSRPRIATISSQMGALSRKSTGAFAYRSSKAAVNKVMQVLSLEFEADGIIVCPIHPGWVRTDMGGPHAYISVEDSAHGLFSVISNLAHEHSGRFWTWQGEEHPW